MIPYRILSNEKNILKHMSLDGQMVLISMLVLFAIVIRSLQA